MTFRLHLSVLSAIAAVGIAVALTTDRTAAQEPPKDGEKIEKSIHEQDIYIPYEKLRQVFEKHGRGVFLPYEKFQELWQAAQDKTKPTAEPKPPVGALITEIENEATVEKDVVRVKAKLKIEVLAEGWNEIPLRLADAAITSATLGGQPARIIGGPSQDYRLLIEKKGKQPEQMELLLEYAKAITRMPGQNSVAFQAPQAPVSRWRVAIPQAGVKVNLHPLIAATEVPLEKKPEGEPAKKIEETVVLAFVGAAPMVRIDWTPKAEGATGLAAMASVQAEQQVWINEGVARTRTVLNYAISRAELAQLTIDVPADQKVVNVFDANVRQWSVEPLQGQQRITAQLFEPAKSAQQVTVELEKFAGEKSRDTIDVPAVKAAGVGRQQGVVVVQVAEGLRVEAAKTSGLLQVDAAELPPALKQAKWAFSYRYAAVPFALALSIEKVEPRIVTDSLVEAYLEPERLSLDLAAIYTIEKAGVFRLELDIPAGYEVRQVRGAEIAGAAPVQVDAHHLEGEGKTRLVVNLSRKAIGRVGLVVQLQKDLHQPELLAPTGKSADIPLAIPRVAAGGVERATGRLVIYAPESLRVNPAKTAGLRNVSFDEAFKGLPSPRQDKPDGLRPVLGFAFTPEPVTLSLAAERKKPQVTIGQLLVARVEEGVVKYQITLSYTVLYSGVKSLRIDVPAEVAGGLRVATAGVREKAIDPPPANLTKDCVAWSLTGESEMIGDGKIELTWEKKIEKLDIGKSVELAVPHLRPREVDRAWGQIVLVKSETIDVHEAGEPKSLRPIDPQRDLMAPVPSAARAFEFHDDWTLSITATRYKLEEVKRTSIERAVVRMVVTPAKEISVQALYRMKSARQRLVIHLPEGAAFDTQPLRINGRRVSLETGQKGEFFVPLVDPNADAAFLLELRYTLPGDGSRLDLPAFPDEPAVVKAYLCVYLPETRALLGARGPWTEEFGWWLDPSLQWRPAPRVDANYLASWVREGVNLAAEPGENFQTDGRLYMYSTLRPAAGPEGSLRTTTIDERWLSALVFLAVVVLGLLLLSARLPTRAVAVGAVVIALVLLGTFCPTFSMQILNGILVSALVIVAVIWTVAFFVRPSAKAPPAPAEAVTHREHGVDLSQYRPEPPEVPAPPAHQPPPSEPPKGDGSEGGPSNG
jgi:hypothetical protein